MNKAPKRRAARIRRLEEAIAKVALSIRCTPAAMRSALAVDEWEDYQAASALCFGLVLNTQQKAEFAKYKRLLRQGDALYARMLKLEMVGREALRRQRLSWAADRKYGAAWETLEQLLIENPFVQAMLDRPFAECIAEAEDIARPLASASEFAKRDQRASQRELLHCQHSMLLASLSRLHEQYAPVDPICFSAEGDNALGWDALFEFADRGNIADAPKIDDTWSQNTDASLLSPGAHQDFW